MLAETNLLTPKLCKKREMFFYLKNEGCENLIINIKFLSMHSLKNIIAENFRCICGFFLPFSFLEKIFFFK